MNIAYIKEILRLRQKTLIVLMAFFLVNLGLAMFASMYQTPRLEALQDEWFKRRQAGGSQKDKGASFEQGTADLEKWRSKISPKKDLARILGELHDLTKSNSLALGSVTYKPEVIKEEKLLSYAVAFTVSGRYASVKSFLADLGRLGEMVTVDAISLNNSKLTEEKVDLRLNLTILLRLEGK